MDKWTTFYKQYFPDEAATQAFVDALEALDIANPMHKAKIMMHQVQRLVTLADQIHDILPGRAAMRVFFLMVCAENIAKMHAKFDEEGKSKAHAVKFFTEFTDAGDKNTLEQSFVKGGKLLELDEAAKLLYAVRNSVVHEGNYWSFDFAEPDMNLMTGDAHDPVTVKLLYRQLRDIVVRAGIQAVKTYTP